MERPSTLWDIAQIEIDHCNKCGFCLPVCPTYRLTRNEMDSPRGRIAMVEAWGYGEIAVDRGLQQSLTYCLGCRACETACPSGVQYHRVLAAGQDALRQAHRVKRMPLVARALLHLVRRPQRLARMIRLADHLRGLERIRALRPAVQMLGYRREPPTLMENPAELASKAPTVAFFEGCVQEAAFPDANRAARALLSWAGYRVIRVEHQTCCGALHAHQGSTDIARVLARQNMVAVEKSVPNATWVANTAGGCGGMLREYGELFSGDPIWEDRARVFSDRVRDWTTLLLQAPRSLRFHGSGERVTFQNSCHLIHVEHAGEDPVTLLKQVTGDIFIPLESQDRCCGSAGIYNLEHPDWATRIATEKTDEMHSMALDRLLVVNPGCHLQMQGAMNQAGQAVVVEHLARYLSRIVQVQP